MSELASERRLIGPALLCLLLLASAVDAFASMPASAGSPIHFTVGYASGVRTAVVDREASVALNPTGIPWGQVGSAVSTAAAKNLPSTNLSSVNETGTVIRTIATGVGPDFGLFDPLNRLIYFSNPNSNNVTILSGSTVIATVATHAVPTRARFDPTNGFVYVADVSSNNVSVLNGTTLQASIPVGRQPNDIVYDGAHGWIDVANFNSSTVSVLNGTRVIATVPVGLGPTSLAFDSRNGLVYTADYSSGSISVLNGTALASSVSNLSGSPYYVTFDPFNGLVYASTSATVDVVSGSNLIAAIPVGGNPNPPAIDPRNGWAYFATSGTGNVTVVNGSHLQVTVVVGNHKTFLFDPVYDPDNGYVYVPHLDDTGGGRNVTVIDRNNVIATITVGNGPTGEVYDPFNGWLYVANFGNGAGTTISVISTLLAQSPMVATPAGSPLGSIEAGQGVALAATLWGLGAGGDTATYTSLPSNGLGCESMVKFTIGDQTGTSTLTCTPVTAGNYTVSLSVNDRAGRVVSSSIHLAVYPGPLASVHLSHQFYDVGQTLALTAAGSLGSGGYTFQWAGIPAGCPAVGPTITCLLTTINRYSVNVTVTDLNGVSAGSRMVSVDVNPLLALGPTSYLGDPIIKRPLTFLAVLSGGTAPTNWTWLFGDGSRATGPSPVYAYQTSGTFTVTVWANDSANASAERTLNLTLADSSSGPAPTLFGLPPIEGYLLVGGVISAVVVVVLAAAVLIRGRKPQPNSPDSLSQ